MNLLRSLFVLLLAGLASASAPHLYLAQSTTGSGSGLSCINALAGSFFNPPGNWGPAANQIGPGSTIHLCGTFNAPAGASGYFSFQGSGTSSAPITVLAEPGAVLQAPWWGVNGALFGNGQSYLIFDGGTNGIIRATGNGTAYVNKQDGAGLDYGEGSNIVVRNFSIGPIYTRTGTVDQLGQDTFGIRGGNGVASNSVRVTNNTISDAKWCMFHSFRAGVATTDLEQDHNLMASCDHGIFDGTGNTNAVFTKLRIHHNRMGSMANWDDLANNTNHHDAYHINGHSGSSILDVQFYSNTFDGDAGITTNACFYTYPDPGTYHDWYLFNNVCHNTGTSYMANGCFALVQVDAAHILNNTCVSDKTTDIGIHYLSSTRGDFRNNIFKIPVLTSYNSGFLADDNTPAAMNYNVWRTGSGDFKINGAFYPNIGALQAAFGFEVNGTGADPLLNMALVPQVGSSALGKGQNLTALCTTVTALCVDLNGSARSSSGPWDIGAFTTATIPPPPVTTISISPATVTLGQGATQQFAATVVNGPSPAWTLTGAGAISASGLYMAPVSILSPQTVTVKATSGSAGASAVVSLVPPVAVPPGCIAGTSTAVYSVGLYVVTETTTRTCR